MSGNAKITGESAADAAGNLAGVIVTSRESEEKGMSKEDLGDWRNRSKGGSPL